MVLYCSFIYSFIILFTGQWILALFWMLHLEAKGGTASFGFGTNGSFARILSCFVDKIYYVSLLLYSMKILIYTLS